MRYRKLDANGDMQFGRQQSDFYVNVPRAVAQAALTRLQLYHGEWFVDTSDGTQWYERVLGRNTRGTRDLEIKNRVLGTLNLTRITAYSSNVASSDRTFSVAMSFDTAYGKAQLQLAGTGATAQFSIG